MTHKTLFICGLALASLAVAMGVRIALSPIEGNTQSEPIIRDSQPRSSASSERRMNSTLREQRPTRIGERDMVVRPPFSVGLPEGSSPELVERAAAVERHANIELERLTRRLDLSMHQRARLFPILAAGSVDYHPAMTAPGLSHADLTRIRSGELGLDDVLTPEQKDEQIARTLDDSALWREVFENLKRQLEASTPEVSDDPMDEQPMPNRRNIYELVDP